MEIIKNIAATEEQTWETLATAIDNNFLEQQEYINNKQPAGDYALKSQIPNKVSQLSNDLNFVTENSINEKIGDINTILDNINGEII